MIFSPTRSILAINASGFSGSSLFHCRLLGVKTLLFEIWCLCSMIGVASVRGSVLTTRSIQIFMALSFYQVNFFAALLCSKRFYIFYPFVHHCYKEQKCGVRGVY